MSIRFHSRIFRSRSYSLYRLFRLYRLIDSTGIIRSIDFTSLQLVSEDKLVGFRMFLPESLRASFKSACALRGLSMNEVLVNLVKQWIEEQEGQLRGRPAEHELPDEH